MESFSFLQKFKISFERQLKIFSQKKIQKHLENRGNKKKKLPQTFFFTQFGIFGNISGFLWIQNRPKIVAYIVHNIFNIFALALEKRKMPPADKQPNVNENWIFKLSHKNTRFYINFIQI